MFFEFFEYISVWLYRGVVSIPRVACCVRTSVLVYCVLWWTTELGLDNFRHEGGEVIPKEHHA